MQISRFLFNFKFLSKTKININLSKKSINLILCHKATNSYKNKSFQDQTFYLETTIQ